MWPHFGYIQKVVGFSHTVKRNRKGTEDDEDEDGDGGRLCVYRDLLTLTQPPIGASILNGY